MRKLYLSLVKSENTVSWPLLIISFIAGYVLATILFHFFGNTVKGLLSFLM